MSDSPERLFLFVQCELPWDLGPPSGRYLLRDPGSGEPERVIVLSTLAARRGRRAGEPGGLPGPLRRRATARRREVAPEPPPAPVGVTRATIIDPVPVSAERQARAWLAELRVEREVADAFAALNHMLHAHRIAAADPYSREVAPLQALTIRAGWGAGEQVAEGAWLHAVELFLPDARKRIRRRAAALRPDERLARMLSAREQPLLCEELTLRARLDLDQGRLAHAAIELDRALLAALGELSGEQRTDLRERTEELRALRGDVARLAHQALGAPTDAANAGGNGSRDAPGAGTEGDGNGDGEEGGGAQNAMGDERETLSHTLGRLEAALRARSAAGVGDA